MRFFSAIISAFLLVASAGCGGNDVTTFPNQLLDPLGNPILLDDVEAIVNDDSLSDDEKRDKLRDLGIEDEDLIEALLPG